MRKKDLNLFKTIRGIYKGTPLSVYFYILVYIRIFWRCDFTDSRMLCVNYLGSFDRSVVSLSNLKIISYITTKLKNIRIIYRFTCSQYKSILTSYN